MSNKDILERAITKAIENGWCVKGGKVTEMQLVPNAGKGIWSQLYTWQKEDENNLGTGLHIVSGLYDFVFNHDFAKALWGEYRDPIVVPHDIPALRKSFKPWVNEYGIDYVDWSHVPKELYDCANCGKKKVIQITGTSCPKYFIKGNTGYKHHLQQMVIADDPIQYLGEHLDD